MTRRTTSNESTPVEKACRDVETAISDIVERAHIANAVSTRQGIDEKSFRRIVAAYFHDKTLRDWMHTLGIEPTENDPQD